MARAWYEHTLDMLRERYPDLQMKGLKDAILAALKDPTCRHGEHCLDTKPSCRCACIDSEDEEAPCNCHRTECGCLDREVWRAIKDRIRARMLRYPYRFTAAPAEHEEACGLFLVYMIEEVPDNTLREYLNLWWLTDAVDAEKRYDLHFIRVDREGRESQIDVAGLAIAQDRVDERRRKRE
jgi:hypothetical protein